MCYPWPLDLLLKDIKKLHWVDEALSLVPTVVNLIRGHDVLDKVFLEYSDGKNLLIYGQTRMATWFLMAQRLLEQKANLDRTFTNPVFETWRERQKNRDKQEKALQIKQMVLGDQVWWNTLQHIHEMTEDIVKLLRPVDGPLESSGKVYYYMARLAANFADDSQKFPWLELQQRHELLDLINFRWESLSTLHFKVIYACTSTMHMYLHTAFPPP